MEKVNVNRKSNRPILAVTYDRRLPDIQKIVKTHYDAACKDPVFKENFPERPLVAYRKQKTIGDFIIRAKLHPMPSNRMNLRGQQLGFKTCTRKDNWGCILCRNTTSSKTHKSSNTREVFGIKSAITCRDEFVLYDIECKKCGEQYVGKTTQSAVSRYSGHKSSVVTGKVEKSVGDHFNRPGHNVSDMIFTPFEKVWKKDETLLRSREEYWIEKKQTFTGRGMNKER